MSSSTAAVYAVLITGMGIAALITAICLQAGLGKKRMKFPHLQDNWHSAQRYITALFVLSGLLVLSPAVVFGISQTQRIETFTASVFQERPSDLSPESLLDAVWAGDLSAAQESLENGADPDSGDQEIGVPALLIACDQNDTDMVKLLLEYGADPDLRTTDGGLTPLMYAGAEPKIVQMLIDAGADVNAVDDENLINPLSEACVSYRSLESTRILLENGANISYCTSDGYTVLEYLAEIEEGYEPELIEEQYALVKLLVDHGAAIPVPSPAYQSSYDVAKELMQEQAALLTEEQQQVYLDTADQILRLLQPSERG